VCGPAPQKTREGYKYELLRRCQHHIFWQAYTTKMHLLTEDTEICKECGCGDAIREVVHEGTRVCTKCGAVQEDGLPERGIPFSERDRYTIGRSWMLEQKQYCWRRDEPVRTAVYSLGDNVVSSALAFEAAKELEGMELPRKGRDRVALLLAVITSNSPTVQEVELLAITGLLPYELEAAQRALGRRTHRPSTLRALMNTGVRAMGVEGAKRRWIWQYMDAASEEYERRKNRMPVRREKVVLATLAWLGARRAQCQHVSIHSVASSFGTTVQSMRNNVAVFHDISEAAAATVA
jgi:hypothetical protein